MHGTTVKKSIVSIKYFIYQLMQGASVGK